MKKIPVEVSAKHIHLSSKDLEALFGKGYELKKLKGLTQPGQFSAKETLDIKAGDKRLKKIRIVGPAREKTQVELSFTDAVKLGISPPVRKSGSLKGSKGVVLVGPKKTIKLKQGVIIPWRHIHCSSKEAKSLGIKNGDLVSVKIEGERTLTFHKVKIRVNDDYNLCMHIDTDEGNAAGIIKKGIGILIHNSCLSGRQA